MYYINTLMSDNPFAITNTSTLPDAVAKDIPNTTDNNIYQANYYMALNIVNDINNGFKASGFQDQSSTYEYWPLSDITSDQLATDEIYSNCVRDYITSDLQTSGNYSPSFLFSMLYAFYGNMFGFTSLNDRMTKLIKAFPTSNYNYAVRIICYEANPSWSRIFDIVDCSTGEAKFRITGDSNFYVPIQYVKRFDASGNISTDLSLLSMWEYMQIASCVKFEIINRKICLTGFLKLAVKPPEDYKGSHILGIPFLPWNNMTYNIYNLMTNEYMEPSAYTKENLYTIIKLIGIGILIYEGVNFHKNHHLILPHLSRR